MSLLDVQGLTVRYSTKRGEVHALERLSIKLEQGEALGLVGESGCGKTTAAKAILHLLADNARIQGGEIIFRGQRIDHISEKAFDRLRWRQIAVISQSAMNALNPVYRVGNQIVEAIQTHEKTDRKTARERVTQLFQWVGLPPERVRDYPHQFSGGMKQRAIIAMSLALNPAMIIADEPTTALDVVMQDQVMEQLVRVQQESESSILMISHDISVLTEVCRFFVVMYAGKVVESCTVENFHTKPCHPYSMGLLLAFPTLEGEARTLVSIPGFPPDLSKDIGGCLFRDRCPFQQPVCEEEDPPDVEVEPGHLSKCHFADKADEMRPLAQKEETWEEMAV